MMTKVSYSVCARRARVIVIIGLAKETIVFPTRRTRMFCKRLITHGYSVISPTRRT
jgi:hypothetical protein